MQRYLLQVRLTNGNTFDKLFYNEEDMKEFIMARNFFFITADYNIYDLAIQLK